MKTQYIADDGTVFASESECLKYERKTSAPKDVLMWDENQQPISYQDFINEPESVEYLWVKSEESLNILHHTAEWFYSIKEPGFYFYDDRKGWVNFDDLEEQYVNLSRFVCRVKQAENWSVFRFLIGGIEKIATSESQMFECFSDCSHIFVPSYDSYILLVDFGNNHNFTVPSWEGIGWYHFDGVDWDKGT